MTQKKKQKGFTLVEVIVVAVIVAVLAAVAVPIYLNYVRNSKISQANNIAGAVASFCGACQVDGNTCLQTTAPTATSGGTADCQDGGGTSNGSTITLPVGYTVAGFGASPGSITATNIADGTIQSDSHSF